mgnify:CR=1 FL=1
MVAHDFPAMAGGRDLLARLHDAGWSRFAQGLAIGVVREVTPLESNPTRLEIRVRPVEDPRRLDRFLVVSQSDASGDAP